VFVVVLNVAVLYSAKIPRYNVAKKNIENSLVMCSIIVYTIVEPIMVMEIRPMWINYAAVAYAGWCVGVLTMSIVVLWRSK
jgi:hypothetical protein